MVKLKKSNEVYIDDYLYIFSTDFTNSSPNLRAFNAHWILKERKSSYNYNIFHNDKALEISLLRVNFLSKANIIQRLKATLL